MENAAEVDDWSDDGGDALYLRDIAHSKTLHLGLRANYAPWEPWQAFRELVQNWRDGIIQSFDLDEDTFEVIHEDNSRPGQDEILYKVARPGSNPREWLGYIRFTGKYGTGSVEIVNRKATIEPWHLDLGGTTKAGVDNQAGQHGDGLKVALLAFLRKPQNLSVRCLTGGFSWNFNFNTSGKLVARLFRRNQSKTLKELTGAETAHRNRLIPFVPNHAEDVIFVIGKEFQIRNGIDKKTLWSAKVGWDEFIGWTKAALFLKTVNQDQIVKTSAGDLLLDPSLKGRIYLKGLLLKESVDLTRGINSASMSGKPLRYGYNFAEGTTNRDRQSVADAHEESQNIQEVWSHALEERGDLIGGLHDMLNSKNPRYADVSMAEDTMTGNTVMRLKDYLFSGENSKKWYYSTSAKIENRRLLQVIRGLRREGAQLEDSYWRILDTRNVVRTAEDEQAERFLASMEISIPETLFTNEVDRLLRSAFRSCHQTVGITIRCVRGGDMDLLSIYNREKDEVRIHESWFSKEDAAVELGLDLKIPETTMALHTAKHLFGDVLDQMPEELFPGSGNNTRKEPRDQEKVRIEQRMLEYRQLKNGLKVFVKIDYPTSKLVVQWNEQVEHELDSDVLIQVHRVSTCAQRFKNILLGGEVKTCPNRCSLELAADFDTGWVKFTGNDLKVGEEYFAVAVKGPDDCDDSFVAISENTCKMIGPGLKAEPVPKNEKYTVGGKLESLDIMKPRDWYDATNDAGKKGVIGLIKPAQVTGSKRARTKSSSSVYTPGKKT
ncbi:hypothetical protein SCAR479_14033 [Seiridium cardinale]|uniref:Uncharacterized protein n=1 Tax=Seiridium cardinale TaxID=138064 RepID=A0ABR2X6A5_9PEZI